MVARVESSLVSVSSGSDGERVSVVGEDAPLGPDPLAVVAFEPAAVHPVAAFEVADPSFGAGSVSPQPALGASEPGCWRPAMNTRRGRRAGERGAGRSGVEPAVERDLRGRIPSRAARQQFRAAACSRPGCRSATGPGRTSPLAPRLGVLGHLRDLRDVPELVRLAELALADRPRVRVGERHDPVLDRLARDAQLAAG